MKKLKISKKLFQNIFDLETLSQKTSLFKSKGSKENSKYSGDIPKSFAYSGCGWLIPFYLGVIESFKQRGMLNSSTIHAGTSGGSLAALVACSNFDTKEALDSIIEISNNPEFKKNINEGLKRVIKPKLPKDVIKRCNGRLYITTTKLWPNPDLSPTITSQFNSVTHLLDVLAASCFIPFYSCPDKVFTNIGSKSGYYIDGGVLAFMPPVGEIKISPFPRRFKRGFQTPHIHLEKDDFPPMKLKKWILFPAPPEEMRKLYIKGFEHAEKWIISNVSLNEKISYS